MRNLGSNRMICLLEVSPVRDGGAHGRAAAMQLGEPLPCG